MGAPLVKLRSVCKTEPFGRYEVGRLIGFTCAEEDELPRRVVYITREDWEDIGSPDTITLTVEPGDLLNDVE